jgi:hypothetical protein
MGEGNPEGVEAAKTAVYRRKIADLAVTVR